MLNMVIKVMKRRERGEEDLFFNSVCPLLFVDILLFYNNNTAKFLAIRNIKYQEQLKINSQFYLGTNTKLLFTHYGKAKIIEFM